MKTLVIGASSNPQRYSFLAVNKLLDHNHEVVAIGRNDDKVASVQIQTGFPQLKDVHTVTLYVNPLHQQDYYDYIISLKPKRVLFNPGTENPELYQLLEQNNIPYEAACTLVLLSINQF